MPVLLCIMAILPHQGAWARHAHGGGHGCGTTNIEHLGRNAEVRAIARAFCFSDGIYMLLGVPTFDSRPPKIPNSGVGDNTAIAPKKIHWESSLGGAPLGSWVYLRTWG